MKYFILFLVSLGFYHSGISQIYTFDVKNATTYSYNCGTTNGSYWGVKGDSCSLITSPTLINQPCANGGTITLPITVKINQTGQLSCTDTAWIEYTTDNGSTWLPLDTIIGCEQSANSQYNYYPEVSNNCNFQLKVTFDNSAPNDWWQIMNGDIVINDPCFLLSLDEPGETCGTEDEAPAIPISSFKSPFDSVVLPIKVYVYDNIVDKAEIYKQFEIVKEHFSSSNIKIQVDDNINKIEGEMFYDYSRNIESELLETGYDSNVVNIYVLPNVRTTSNILGYTYINGPNAIFVSYSGFINKSTLSHELGHKLGLMHTHAFGNELVNGDNCDIDGDRICDTPADPKLTGKVNDCSYVGKDIDLNGDPYNPDINNIMSYSLSNCRNYFSYGQIEVMENVLFNMNLSPILNQLVFTETIMDYPTGYYDLHGRKINNPLPNHLYIKVDGQNVEKNIFFE